MRKLIIFIIICSSVKNVNAQTISQKIATAYKQFENDSQLKHAISSLYVIDAATGKVVFDRNSQIGLAPASSQKIITAATAFELLGKDYRYKTEFYISSDSGKSFLVIKPSGDPTLGSWRWSQTKEDVVFNRIVSAIRKTNAMLSWPIFFDGSSWNSESIPNGWIWQDIGNYYGAGAELINWQENQFDIKLQSGSKTGELVKIIGTTPDLYNYKLSSQVTAAPKGSGDNAYVYFPVNGSEGIIRGTIPVNEKSFTISGSFPSAKTEFENILVDSLTRIIGKPNFLSSVTALYQRDINGKLIYTEISPALDSIIYWLLKKSINLYGEALLKTMGFEKRGFGATDTGINVIKDFWKLKGIDPDELNIYDGSGLSPMNRVTTHVQVEILKYAKKQSWFRYFYDALPEYNAMKLKSGTIGDVKAFCGYHTSKSGKNYIISFIVNNYSGSSSTLVNKMYRVLDVLK